MGTLKLACGGHVKGGGCLMSVFNMRPTMASFFLFGIILCWVDVFRPEWPDSDD